MQRIRERSLDRLYNLEEELLSGKGDLAEVIKPLQVSSSPLYPYPGCST